jgi:hypothetical protein
MTTKVFNYSVALYEYLDTNARDATEGKVWEGSLRVAAETIELPEGYYQRCRQLLGNLQCIMYLRTGHGKNIKSLIHLVQPPTLELYNEYRATANGKKDTKTNDVLNGRLNDMANRMANIERDMRTLMGIVKTQHESIIRIQRGDTSN